MKILFVHQNFPAQFVHLAPALAARGHEVLALTAQSNARPQQIRTLRYRDPVPPPGEGIGHHYRQMAERGMAAARAARVMAREHGYRPDVVFGHGGWGETLFLREVWPEARHLTYAEFYYRPRGLDSDFDPEFQRGGLEARAMTVARRAHLLQALSEADMALSATEWQASTFPAALRDRISVIHDGIDTKRAAPDPAARFVLPSGRALTRQDPVISFVSRNLEPYRGFHIFLRALPAVLRARPEAQVVIVGGTERGYGPMPAGGQSWKDVLLREMAGQIDLARVHFTGRIPHAAFLGLMQVSRVHAYLTYPFVLSWSLLEAMSAGAYVLASRTPPVEEVIREGETGTLVDFFDIPAWSGALIRALDAPHDHAPIRAAARRSIVARYDLETICLPRQIAFVEGAGSASDGGAVPGL